METKDLIYRDDLTGVYNRRAFREHLERDLALPQEQIKGLYIALVDLDHFKKINDAHGHLGGDYMIKEFSKILVDGLRDTDSLVTRYGGDEFVIISGGMEREKILGIWDRLRQDLTQKEFILPGSSQAIHVTMSIGVSEYPADGKTADELFARADEALYSSKHLGRNRVSLAKDILTQVREEKRIQKNILKPLFVDREKELVDIENFFFCQEPNKLILIDGDIGSGKSRFLEEIIALSNSKNTASFFLNCTEIQKDKPYSLLADILNAINYKYPEVCKKAFDSLQLKEKSVLPALPKLKMLADSTQSPPQWDADTRLDLFHALSGLFEHIICELRPLILIDNLDWIDEASAAVMSYIIVSKKAVPLRLCGSDSRLAAVEEKRAASFLDTLHQEISEFEIVPHIHLQPLSKMQTEILLKNIFSGVELPEHFTDSIYRVTEGNPFFIVELLRDLLSRAIIHLKYPVWIFDEKTQDLPRDLKELLVSKFKAIDSEEREMLLAASGVGGNFQFDFLVKLKKINNGYLQDIFSKAADKNIFKREEVGAAGALSFNNELTRIVFYESIDEHAKNKLHLDIATTLESEFKDNPEVVSSELVFHFNRANLQAKAKEYTALALAYMDKLFSDTETERFIEEAIREREEKEKKEPIKKEAWSIVIEIISALNSAIRSMQMYQIKNEIADRMIGTLLSASERFFKLQNNLTLSNPAGEAKDSYKLLVNGSVFPVTSTVEEMVSKRLIDIMRQFNIGSISFHRTISKNDIEAFVDILSNPKLFAEKKESWQKTLADKKIFAINIDGVVYKRVFSEEEKKELHKEIIRDFVTKKVVMDDIAALSARDADAKDTGSAIESGSVSIGKKIIGATAQEKNVLAKAIANLPINVVVETIANEYARRKINILDIKEMVLVCLENIKQRDQMLALLWARLEGIGMSRNCFEWLLDETDFLKHSVKKRANVYLTSDAKTLLEMGVVENLKPTLTELFSLQEDQIAQEIIDKYLENFRSSMPELRAYMAATLQDILDAIPSRLAVSFTKKFIDAFLNALKKETEIAVVELIAKDMGFIMSKLQELKDYINMDYLLSGVKKEVEITAKGFEQKRTCIENALRGLELETLYNQLLQIMDSVALDSDKNELILGIFKKLMPRCLPCLLELLLNRPAATLQFVLYAQNLRVIDILKEFKKDSVPEIEKMLDSEAENKVDLAFDILNHFRDENLMHLYAKSLNSKNKNVRKRAMEALIELDTDLSFKMIEDLFLKEDPDMQKNIIIYMGEYSHQKTILEFLLNIRDTKSQVHNKKEALEAINRIQKRIGK